MKISGNMDYLIATVFGLGYFPVAPGTAGSVAGLALCLLLHKNPVLYIGVFIILFVAGLISAGRVESQSQIKDPSIVVIDECACIFSVFLFVPINLPIILTGFFLYRLIDIIKLPPMRSLEKLRGGWGIMLDDLISGIYTNLILQILIALKLF
ncbi:MAG: phosphatidylglycerophosphatase A [Candidatus Omnitrophota bacterium]|nr:phosphatidylglycerophosphatase A [Candidatus Omnitrophota bacterium]